MPTIGTYNYDNLIAGGVMPQVTDGVTLVSGQAYVRGTVLSLNGDGKATIVDSESATNSIQEPYAILAADVDATEDDQEAPVFLTGEFNAAALIFGGTDTADDHKVALRKIGIFLKNNVEA